MSILLPELTPDILSNLPVKDLLRFRCVCSSWRSLIDSPYFAKLHLSRSEKTGSNLFILDIDNGRIRSLGFESLEKDPEILQLPPIRSSPDPVAIAGSCNGVVALCNYREGDASLWNPSTRKLRKLPSSKIIVGNSGFYPQRVSYGFGYDSEMDDYKLVRIAQFKNYYTSLFSKAEVFSLKMDTWREIDCSYLIAFKAFFYTRFAALVNNALHWVICSHPQEIVCFDLAKEEFYLVPSYPDCNNPKLPSPQVGVLGGCLSMTFNHKYSPPFGLDVWVMKEYGVKETWSKLLFLPFPFPHAKMNPSSPIAYSKDHRRILLNYSRQLTWYDLTTKALDFLDAIVIEPALCMESLVALD